MPIPPEQRSERPRKFKWWWVIAPLLLVVGVALFLPAISPCREAQRRVKCLNNLANIGRGMSKYHNAHGRFPPAFIVDKNGRRLHSWRLLLLPYLAEEEYTELFGRIKLDEPWDSPHNKAVFESAKTPVLYRCPSAGDDPRPTSYAMIVGPGTISDGPNGRHRGDIIDGLDKTVIVVEADGYGIPWYEPRDLDFEHMSFKINDAQGKAIRSKHPGVAMVLFADGSVRPLNQDLRSEFIKSLITIAGGEDVQESYDY